MAITSPFFCLVAFLLLRSPLPIVLSLVACSYPIRESLVSCVRPRDRFFPRPVQLHVDCLASDARQDEGDSGSRGRLYVMWKRYG